MAIPSKNNTSTAMPTRAAPMLRVAKVMRHLHNQVDAVALACAIGAVFFAWRCWEDLQTTWPAFKAEMQRRTAERQRAPLAADDTH
ncbi:TPA: hypothetical protein ACXM51_000189 [Stenotrophomonas maltophilia]